MRTWLAVGAGSLVWSLSAGAADPPATASGRVPAAALRERLDSPEVLPEAPQVTDHAHVEWTGAAREARRSPWVSGTPASQAWSAGRQDEASRVTGLRVLEF